jgi:surface polysaccharide O-acyltransferase-like enzyme
MPKIYWISNLRVLATLTVIMLHTASNGIAHYGSMPAQSWWICNIFNTFGRFAVPVFVLLSGYLLLDRYNNLEEFLRKRFVRIFIPFLIWLFIYMVYGTFRGFGRERIDWLSSDWLIRILTNDASGSGHLWFVYMLLGLYLFTPIVSRWLTNAPKIEIEFFLGMWLLANVCFLILEKNIHIKPFFDFRYFTGFIGYFVGGAYLKKYPVQISLNNKIIAFLLFMIGWVATMFLAEYFSKQAGKYADLLGYHSPFVVMMSIGIVIFFQQNFDKPFAEKFISEIDTSSYGIYLLHWLVMKILSREFQINFAMYQNPIPGMMAQFIITSLICIFVIGIVRRLPKGYWITG